MGLDVRRVRPAYQLRERLMRRVDAPVGTREEQVERFALMIKGWNLWTKAEAETMREFVGRPLARTPSPSPGSGRQLQA